MDSKSLFEAQMEDFMQLVLERLSELTDLPNKMESLAHEVEGLTHEVSELRLEVRTNHQELLGARLAIRKAGEFLVQA